jgi:hypothetical protein
MQLRYLQTLNSIATEQNSTIIFPLPVDLFSLFQKNQLNLGKTTTTTTNPFALTPTIPDDTNINITGKLISTDI